MLDIRSHIYSVRGVQIMLDEDLAILYGSSTMRLNEQVKRNKSRFPQEFCFQLTKIEYDNLISQIAISKKHGGRRKLPFAFTEQGVAMLSGVLNSDIAIHISIQIMSEFVSMRKLIQVNSQLFARIDNIEQKQISDKDDTDKKFNQVFDALAGNKDIPKQNLFFDGQTFDAYLFVSKLIRSAEREIILIDNFVDETIFMLLGKHKTGVAVTIYSKNINSKYPSIEIKELNFSHDRFLIIDSKYIYHFGASIKDLGKKWCAVSKLEIDTLKMLERLS